MGTSHYDIARTVKIMGMQTTVKLDPTKVTVRVKNNVKRMLRMGRIQGNGDAANIADQIRKKFALPVTRDWWRGMEIGTVSVDTKHLLRGIMEADWAAQILDSPGYNAHPYYRERHAEAILNLKSPGAKNFNLAFHDRAFYEQAANVMAASMTERDKKVIEDAIVYLDGTELIYITTY